MRARQQRGGLFPEDRRRTKPVPSEPAARDDTAESCLRSRILRLLHRSDFQAAVTDAKTVQTPKGKRQLVYPEGWPDITASLPVTGRAWAIEVKAEGEELRPSQVARLAELEAAGWLVTVAEGERGVVEVGAEIRRHVEHLWKERRGEYQRYLTRLTTLRREAEQRAAEHDERERARRR